MDGASCPDLNFVSSIFALKCSYITNCRVLSDNPNKLADNPLYNPKMPSCFITDCIQCKEFRYRAIFEFFMRASDCNCILVLTSQIGLVQSAVQEPDVMADAV